VAVRDDSLEPQLRSALEISASPDTHANIAIALLALNPARSVKLGSNILNTSSLSLATKQKVAQALIDANNEDARMAVVSAIKSAPEREQSKLALALTATKPGAETLLSEVEHGRVPARLLQDRTLKEKVIAAKPADAAVRLTKLTENLSPLNLELQKLIDQRRKSFASARSSAVAGAPVFEKTCAPCHQIDGKGNVVGPQLDGIGARGAERVLEDILDPNRNVDSAFRTTIFVLDDGDVVSGLFRREEGEQIIYAESTGKEQAVAKSRVKERKPSELSLMPEGLADGLSAQEFNDLLAFLLSKSGAKK
jgi:putative heme-binding domain-containing protein